MTLRARDKAALGAVAGVLLVIIAYLVIIAPVHHTATHLNTQIAAEQQTLSADETTVQEGKAAERSLHSDAQQWQALGKAVPSTSNVPALLNVIASAARHAHASVQSISLSGGSAAAPATTATSTGGPVAVPVSFTFMGDYHALHQLLYRLDSLVLISGTHVRASGPLMSIASVSLTGSGSKISAQVAASIYQLTTPAASTTTLTGESS